MESWGFRYVSNIVWAKRRKDGGPDGRGVGFYFRNVTELLKEFVKEGALAIDLGDEVLQGACVTHGGAVVNEAVKAALAARGASA